MHVFFPLLCGKHLKFWAMSDALPTGSHGAWHIVGAQYIFKKWLKWVLNSANLAPPILVAPFQRFFAVAHYSCGWYELKLLKKDVISLVNIITTIYYHSTKVITFSFSVAYTHHRNYLWRRNLSCLFSVTEWNAAKFGEYICSASFEWQVRKWGHLMKKM